MSKRYKLIDIAHPWGSLPESKIDDYCYADIYDTLDTSASAVERLPYKFFKTMMTSESYSHIANDLEFVRTRGEGLSGISPARFSANAIHKYRTEAEVSYSISNIGIIVDENDNITSMITRGTMIIESGDGLDFIRSAIGDDLNAPEKNSLMLHGLARQNKDLFHAINIESYRLRLRRNNPVVLKSVSAWNIPRPFEGSDGDLLFDVGFSENVKVVKKVIPTSPGVVGAMHGEGQAIAYGPFEVENGYMLRKPVHDSHTYVPASRVPFLGTLLGKGINNVDFALSAFWITMLWDLGYMELGI